jgi:hypothetical protein
MDIVSRREVVNAVIDNKLGICCLADVVWSFLLEYVFCEDNQTTFVDEKTYLRMLCFQTVCYLEDSVRVILPIPRKRSGNKHKVHYPIPTIKPNNTYFESTTKAFEIVRAYTRFTCSDSHIQNIDIPVPFDMNDIVKCSPNFVVCDKRMQICWRKNHGKSGQYEGFVIVGFVQSDPKFWLCLYEGLQ